MAAKPKNPWVKKWQVKSFTTSDTYTVSLKADNTYGCSCSAWVFQRKKLPDGHCKHIFSILGLLKQAALDINLSNSMLGKMSVEFDNFQITLLEDRGTEVAYVVPTDSYFEGRE